MNNSNKETILIKNIEQLKQMIKDRTYNNYELVEPIMIKGVKCSKPRTEPKQKPKTLRQLMLEGFDKINNRIDDVNTRLDNVEKHLDNVDKRLDNVDNRLDNVEKHLKEHDLIFKRNNLI